MVSPKVPNSKTCIAEDLSYNDHRLVTKMLISLAVREKTSNLRRSVGLTVCQLEDYDRHNVHLNSV